MNARMQGIAKKKNLLSLLLVLSFTIGILQIIPGIAPINQSSGNDNSQLENIEVPIDTGTLKDIGTEQPTKNYQAAYVETKDYVDAHLYTANDVGSTTSFSNMRIDDTAYATLSEAPTFTSISQRTYWNSWMPLVTTPSTGWCEMEYDGHDDWEYDALYDGQDDSYCAIVDGDLGAVDEGIMLSSVYDLSSAGYFEYSVYLYANAIMAHDYELEVYFLDNTGHYDRMFDWQDTEPRVLGWGYKEIVTNQAQYMHAGFRVKYQATDINALQVCGVDVHRLEAYGSNRIYQQYRFNGVDYDEFRVEVLVIDLQASVTEYLNFEVLDGSIWRPVGSVSASGLSYLNIHPYVTSDTLDIRVTDSIHNYDYLTQEWHVEQMYLSMEDHIPRSYAMPVCDSLYDGNNIYAMKTPRSDSGDSYAYLTTYHTDGDGFDDIRFCEIQGYNGSSVLWSVRYDNVIDSYSLNSGSNNIGAATGTEYRSGNLLHIKWRIEFKFTHPDLANMDIRAITQDQYSHMTTECDTNWDVETRLVSAIEVSDGSGNLTRGDINGDIYCHGAVVYYDSTFYPPEFAIDIYVFSSEVVGSPWAVVYEDWMLGEYWRYVKADDQVGQDLYRSKIVEAGAGSSGTDLLVYDNSVGYVADRITVLGYTSSDNRVNVNSDVSIDVTLEYEFDTTAVSTGTVVINGQNATHITGGVWRLTKSQSTVTDETFESVSIISDVYGISVVNQNSQETTIIWDGLAITMIDPDDSRINVGETVTGINASAVYNFDGTPYDGTLVLNSTTYTFGTIGKRGYTISSASGDSYGITVIVSNDETWCIWDEIEVVLLESSLWNLVNDSFKIWCSLQLAYDNHLLGASDTAMIADDAATWNGTHFVLEISYPTVGDKYLFVNSSSESTWGISLIGDSITFLTHITNMPSIDSIGSDFEATNSLYQGIHAGPPLWIHWDPVNDPSAPSFSFTIGGAYFSAWNVTSSWSGLAIAHDISPGTFVCTVESGLPYSESNYTYTILALNDGGYIETQVVYIIVRDYTDPVIETLPPDIEMTEGDTGLSIVWTCTDANPQSFEIRQDGVPINNSLWSLSPEDITVVLDGLDVGEYVYEITIYDERGNSFHDSVTVVVNESTTSTTTTTTTATSTTTTSTTGTTTSTNTTSTGTDIPDGMLTITLVIIFGVTVIIVLFIIILKKR